MENSFGEFFKLKRQEKNLTQKQLAKKLFVSESTVSKWEKNVANPDISMLPKLCELLGVSEHELITASVDKKAREEKIQAKKWRTLSFTWSLFFYIAYGVALLPCFICNLAIDKTLSWFWIVLCSLILSFTFTNLPKLIKNYKLILLPLSSFLALCLLLGTCCIYTNGSWFFIASFPVFLGLAIVFVPIYIAKYPVFSKVKRYNDFVSVGIDFILINLLLIIVNSYTRINGVAPWYFNTALPIVSIVYLIINLLMCVRFLRINKLLKTSIIIFISTIITYLIPHFITTKNLTLQQELNDFNIFKSDFTNWQVNVSLENNIHLIIFLTAITVALAFLTFGILKHIKNRTNK